MPKLGNIQTTRVKLPSSTPDDEAWCDLKTELLLGDLAALNDSGEPTQQAIVLLSKLITAWNFTDADGNAVEPTSEWINKLGTDDFMFLSKWVNDNLAGSIKEGLNNDEKKDLSATSTAVTTELSPPPII